jgi:hypothetical protein
MDRLGDRLMVKRKQEKGVRPKPEAPPKLVLIEWVDAVTDTGWEVGKGHSKIDLVQSIGWLIQKDDTQVIIAGDVSSDKDGLLHTNRRLSVPAQWIKLVRNISDD